MGQAMTRTENSASDVIASMIDDAVAAFRNRGLTREYALEQASLALGIKPRRAKMYLYREPVAFIAAEYQQIKTAYLRHLDDEAEDLARRREAIKARRAQLELEV